MKTIIVLSGILLSSASFGKATWTCECFKSLKEHDPFAGKSLQAQTLGEAQTATYKVCRLTEPNVKKPIIECTIAVDPD